MTEKPKIGFRDGRSYPVLYMFALTFVATGVLIGLSRLTAGRVEVNRRVLFERAVLAALGSDHVRKMSAEAHKAFMENVAEPTESTAGAYRLVQADDVVAYALPFEGQGFWDVIRGVMGITPDGSALTGLAFYEQNETPGLGAEIVKPHFTDQFRNLLLDRSGPSLRLKPAGSRSARNDVDAISGATETCTRLERILNASILEWRGNIGNLEGAGAVRPVGESTGAVQ
ncbi:MAG: FMN-binding protein [Lentisphaerales bacterium]|jgi:Na+-transporting NADH:ubiquinone oxidoreductase subunit NqrC|nr:MAG: FMN-binding protein [Lentisphaerales bacterium]